MYARRLQSKQHVAWLDIGARKDIRSLDDAHREPSEVVVT